MGEQLPNNREGRGSEGQGREGKIAMGTLLSEHCKHYYQIIIIISPSFYF